MSNVFLVVVFVILLMRVAVIFLPVSSLEGDGTFTPKREFYLCHPYMADFYSLSSPWDNSWQVRSGNMLSTSQEIEQIQSRYGGGDKGADLYAPKKKGAWESGDIAGDGDDDSRLGRMVKVLMSSPASHQGIFKALLEKTGQAGSSIDWMFWLHVVVLVLLVVDIALRLRLFRR